MIITNTARVIDNRPLAEDIREIVVERQGLPFKPGMAISIVGPDGETARSFSIASGTAEENFRLIVKRVSGGYLSPIIADARPGDEIRFSGPFGMFHVGKQKPFIFIATGTGIAPLLAYRRSFPDSPPQCVLFGVKHLSNAVGFDEISGWCPATLAVSREKSEPHHFGRVTDLVDGLPLSGAEHFYLCGLDMMLIEVSEKLAARGVSSDRIHTEVWHRARR